MFALVPQPSVFLSGPAVLCGRWRGLAGRLSYGGWPRIWTVYVLAWIGVFAIGAWRAQGEMPTFVMGFPAVAARRLVDRSPAADGSTC